MGVADLEAAPARVVAVDGWRKDFWSPLAELEGRFAADMLAIYLSADTEVEEEVTEAAGVVNKYGVEQKMEYGQC